MRYKNSVKKIVTTNLAGICGILLPFVFFTGILIAISYSPWFKWTHNALSDLGVKGISALIFNNGLIFGGLLAFIFSIGLIKILSNPLLREEMERNNYSFTRCMTWPNIAISHYNLFKRVIPDLEKCEMSFSEIKFDHIKNLTDDFGMLQFANYAKPDKLSGYTLDDNARALLACTLYFKLFEDNTKLKLMKIYLNFIKYVHKNENKLYNFVNYKKIVNLEQWSEDAHGRAMMALGHLIATTNIPMELRVEAELIFENAKKAVDKIRSPRAISFILIGLYFYNVIKNSEVIRIKKLADYLAQLYKDCNSEKWNWFEN